MTVIQVAVLVVSVLAAVFDLRWRRVPNLLTFGAAVVALIVHGAVGGLSGLMAGLGGFAVGLGLFLPIFMLGGMGAGDVKLLAALGAWLGPFDALRAGLFGAVAGSVMALLLALATGYLRQACINLWVLVGYWRIAGLRPLPELTLEQNRGPRLPYAVPIGIGALLSVWTK